MKFGQLFSQIDELYFQELNWLPAFGPGEVNQKEAISQLADNQPVDSCYLTEGDVGITDIAGSPGPIVGRLQIIAIDKF